MERTKKKKKRINKLKIEFFERLKAQQTNLYALEQSPKSLR